MNASSSSSDFDFVLRMFRLKPRLRFILTSIVQTMAFQSGRIRKSSSLCFCALASAVRFRIVDVFDMSCLVDVI